MIDFAIFGLASIAIICVFCAIHYRDLSNLFLLISCFAGIWATITNITAWRQYPIYMPILTGLMCIFALFNGFMLLFPKFKGK